MPSPLPTYNQLKRCFLDSGYEIRHFPRRELERMALDAPAEVKRHLNTNIMGLTLPDESLIGIADDLSTDEQVTTLIHELTHLYDDQISEEEVEQYTEEIEEGLSAEQYGFLQFLVS
jgi:hypothetical protein